MALDSLFESSSPERSATVRLDVPAASTAVPMASSSDPPEVDLELRSLRVKNLSNLIHARDPETFNHCKRVAWIAARLGQELGLSENHITNLYLAGALHDIGKLAIRSSVLHKPGILSDAELSQVKRHTVLGDRMLAIVPSLEVLRSGARSHHERLDGSGYPDGLSGQEIPLMARIIAVADISDALMRNRSYRPAFPTDWIDETLSRGAGRHWDPEIVKRYMSCRREIYENPPRNLAPLLQRRMSRFAWGRTRIVKFCQSI